MLEYLIPGLAQLKQRRLGWGLVWLLFWSFGLFVVLWRLDRIKTYITNPNLAQIIALVSLAFVLVLCWWGSYQQNKRAQQKFEKGVSQWQIGWRTFLKNKLNPAFLIIILFMYLVALWAPLLAPYNPNEQPEPKDVATLRYLDPSTEHWLGTDRFGRDVLSRLIYGSQISLSIGFIAVAIAISLGTLIGAISGFFGGFLDSLIMRIVDMLMAVPLIFLLIILVSMFAPSIWLIIAVLGATTWMGVARLVRGQILSLREQEFIQAAHALGLPSWRIILRHLLPNSLAPIIVAATLRVGSTILVESSSSFLGLGVQPPTPSWGNIIFEARDSILTSPMISIAAGVAIVVTVVAYNIIGDGLRDALDPRQRI